MVVDIDILGVKEKWSTHARKNGQEDHGYTKKNDIVCVLIFIFNGYEISTVGLEVSLTETGISLTGGVDTQSKCSSSVDCITSQLHK